MRRNRRGRTGNRPRVVPASIAAAMLGIVMAGCGSGGVSNSGSPVVPGDLPIPSVDLSLAPVADASDPATGAGAAATFLECRHDIYQGLWSMDVGPPASAPSPDEAVTVFIDEAMFALPRSGYRAAGQDDDRRLYTYSVTDEIKVAVVVADSAKIPLEADEGWVVEAFASCDPSEFDPSTDDLFAFEIWLDEDGNRLPLSTVSTAKGPEHCDWDSATFLRLDGRQYIADPAGALSDFGFTAPFDDDADLPSDAVDTGYERNDIHLWTSSDRTIAYLVDGDSAEAWPSPTETFGCA